MVFISGWSSIPIGQFSIPLQWQLWTLCLDNVNYSIFFGINFEAQNFSTNNHKKGSILKYQSTSRNKFWTTILPTTRPPKKTSFWTPQNNNKPTLKESTNLANPKPANIRSNLKRSKSNHSQMPRCFFQGQKPSRFPPFVGTWNVSNIDAWHVWSAAVQQRSCDASVSGLFLVGFLQVKMPHAQLSLQLGDTVWWFRDF